MSKPVSESVFQSVLENYLVRRRAPWKLPSTAAFARCSNETSVLASEVFLNEPRINEMEILIDEHAIRLLRQGNLSDADVRLIVATLKINNDLERMGDLAVNLSERAISLAAMGKSRSPRKSSR